jgi:hypothetical protein
MTTTGVPHNMAFFFLCIYLATLLAVVWLFLLHRLAMNGWVFPS